MTKFNHFSDQEIKRLPAWPCCMSGNITQIEKFFKSMNAQGNIMSIMGTLPFTADDCYTPHELLFQSVFSHDEIRSSKIIAIKHRSDCVWATLNMEHLNFCVQHTYRLKTNVQICLADWNDILSDQSWEVICGKPLKGATITNNRKPVLVF